MTSKSDIQKLIDNALRKFPSRYPAEDKEDLRQELWSIALGWNGEGELSEVIRLTAKSFVAALKKLSQQSSVEAMGDSEWLSIAAELSAEKIDIDRALSTLSPSERAVIDLLMQGASKRETAKEMGRGETWVWYKRKSAFQKIRKSLGRDYAGRN